MGDLANASLHTPSIAACRSIDFSDCLNRDREAQDSRRCRASSRRAETSATARALIKLTGPSASARSPRRRVDLATSSTFPEQTRLAPLLTAFSAASGESPISSSTIPMRRYCPRFRSTSDTPKAASSCPRTTLPSTAKHSRRIQSSPNAATLNVESMFETPKKGASLSRRLKASPSACRQIRTTSSKVPLPRRTMASLRSTSSSASESLSDAATISFTAFVKVAPLETLLPKTATSSLRDTRSFGSKFVSACDSPSDERAISLDESIMEAPSTASTRPSHSGLTEIRSLQPALTIFPIAFATRPYALSSAAGISSMQTVIRGEPSQALIISREKRPKRVARSDSLQPISEACCTLAPMLFSYVMAHSMK